MAQPPPAKRNASKVVPVIPRSLSRRHPAKPASLPQNGSPLHKEQTKPTSRSRRDSVVRDQGPLIAATPTPAVSAHPPNTSASSSTYEHSFEHHDGASSNSDFSVTASRKDTPSSTISDFSSTVHLAKANTSHAKPHDLAHHSINDGPESAATHASDGLGYTNGISAGHPSSPNDTSATPLPLPPPATTNGYMNGPNATYRAEQFVARPPPQQLSSNNPGPRQMWDRDRFDAIQPFAPIHQPPRAAAPPSIAQVQPAMSTSIAPPLQNLRNSTISRPHSPSQSRNGYSQVAEHSNFDNNMPMGHDLTAPAIAIDNIGPLDWHLHRLFANQDFADVNVEILPKPDLDTKPRNILMHAAVLSRSPRLYDMLKSAKPDGLGLRTIRLGPSVYHNSEQACIDTLWSLYNYDISTINLDGFWQRYEGLAATDGHRAASLASMNELTSTIAIAHFLAMNANAHAWVDMVPKVINADNTIAVVVFALRAGLDQTWLYNSDAPSKSALEKASYFCKSDTAPCEPYASMLIHAVLDFFGAHIAPDFMPDTTALPIFEIDRFPVALAPPVPTRPRTASPTDLGADPRLKNLRLGEFPVNDTHIELLNKTISSTLFSLPFPALKIFLEDPRLLYRMGNAFVATLMQAVIVERERRRHLAVEASFLLEPVNAAKVLNEQLRYDLGIIEAVEKIAQPVGQGHGPMPNGDALHRPGRQLQLSHRLVCRHVPVIFP